MASEHEALVDDVAAIIITSRRPETPHARARRIITIIAERTKEATLPEMVNIGTKAIKDARRSGGIIELSMWRAMHAASALYPHGTDGIEEKAK